MIKRIFWLLFSLSLPGCESYVGPAQNDLGVNIHSLQNESIVIKDAKGLTPPFKVVIKGISDSRCPSDVVCVWAGQASVDFRIEDFAFQLLIGQSKQFDINSQHLKVTLIDVTPYPTTKNTDQKKNAVFIVERL